MGGEKAARAGGIMFLRRADLPDLPPPDFRSTEPPPGWKVLYFPSEIALTNWARANNIADNGHKFFLGGVAPKIQTIGLLQDGLLRDDARQSYVKIHEIGGHAGGLQHGPGGKDWGIYGPDGAYHPVQTRAELAALQAKLYPAPTTFDWAKVLPKSSATDPGQKAVRLAKDISTDKATIKGAKTGGFQ